MLVVDGLVLVVDKGLVELIDVVGFLVVDLAVVTLVVDLVVVTLVVVLATVAAKAFAETSSAK